MKKIKLEDGTELEIHTEEELKELQDKADKVEGLETDIKGKDTQIKDLEAGANPNWAEVRPKIDAADKLTKAMKEQGFVVGDDGVITKKEDPNITSEDVDAKATAAAQKVIFDNHKSGKLLSYDEETQKVIQAKYDLLSAGQTIDSVAGVDAILKEAITLGAPGQAPPDPSSIPNIHSQPPVFDKKGETTPDQTELGKDLGITKEEIEKEGSIGEQLLNNNRE